MPDAQKVMTADKAIKILADIRSLGIKVHLDGGWGIDALIGRETRPHTDVDLLIEGKDLPALKQYFANNDFKQTDNFNKWWHQSYENDTSIIDIHVIEFKDDGSATYGPEKRDDFPNAGTFPAYAFGGKGQIRGVAVDCVTPEYRVNGLTRALLDRMPDNYRYQPTHKDYLDIEKLCNTFGIAMPEELKPLKG